MNKPRANLEVGARSETGFVRNENQDRMSGSEVPLGQLYIVADGMGGHKGGALAAELTIKGLQELIGDAPSNSPVEEVLRTAFQRANETVYQKAHSGDEATENMGSTAVLLLVQEQTARLAHVGDSRAYLYRSGRLEQLTTDHTVVQKMVEAGMIKPSQAADHPNASVLERAVGSRPEVEVEISEPMELVDGDAILLCSDGLSGYVADAEIEKILRSSATVQEVPSQLVELALDTGGEDNVTVQMIQYGNRKEARSRTAVTRKLPRKKPNKQKPSYLTTAVVLLFLAAFGVVAHTYVAGKFEDIKLQITETKNKFEKSVNDFKSQLLESTTRIDALIDQLTQERNESESGAGILNKKIKSLEEELQLTNDKLEQAKNRAGTLDQKSRNTKTELNLKIKEANGLQTKLTAANEKISNLEAQLLKANAKVKPVDAENKVQPTEQEQ